MSLHTPIVRSDAVPPLSYPPSWSYQCTLQGVFIFGVIGSIIQFIEIKSTSVSWFIVVPVCFCAGYYYVSSCILHRNPPLSCRYQDKIVSKQCIYLVISSFPLTCLGPLWQDPEVFGNIFQWFMFPYFLGLHFIYLDVNPLFQSFGCKFPIPNRWSTFTKPEVILLSSISIGATALTTHYASITGNYPMHWTIILIGYGTGALALAGIAWIYRHTYNIHFHHYLLGAALVPLSAFPVKTATALGGVCLGIYTEGIATWGMDPLFVLTRNDIKLH